MEEKVGGCEESRRSRALKQKFLFCEFLVLWEGKYVVGRELAGRRKGVGRDFAFLSVFLVLSWAASFALVVFYGYFVFLNLISLYLVV